jgi:hypothetical protein
VKNVVTVDDISRMTVETTFQLPSLALAPDEIETKQKKPGGIFENPVRRFVV